MNESLFRVYTLRFVVVCFLVATFIGCSNENCIEEVGFPSESYAFSTELERDLQTFAMKHADVMHDIFTNRLDLNGKTRSASESSALYNKLESNILDIKRK